ncbi:hypothetical protein GGI42DRAFT_161861 [Trichoderma sp. SZMC 28013]
MGSEDSVKGRRPVNARELGLVPPLARTVSLCLFQRVCSELRRLWIPRQATQQRRAWKRAPKEAKLLGVLGKARQTGDGRQERGGEEARRDSGSGNRNGNLSPFLEPPTKTDQTLGQESFGQAKMDVNKRVSGRHPRRLQLLPANILMGLKGLHVQMTPNVRAADDAMPVRPVHCICYSVGEPQSMR